jgi:tetratricopeptide (TPR) repeat protein
MAQRSPKTRRADSHEPAPARAERFPWLLLLQVLILVGAGVWAFAPALNGDGLWDDDILVTTNFRLHDWHGLYEIWFNVFWTDYWPVCYTLFWVEWHLWGNALLGYHLTTLGLHLLDGLMVWHVLRRIGLRWAWLGGLLFVLHPLAVESVAWVAETKNTFSVLLFLFAVEAWLDFDAGRRGAYFLAVFLYLMAMLAKSSVIMMPFVILLYAWWKHGSIGWRDVKRIVPFLVIAVILGLISTYLQNRHPATIGANVVPQDTPVHRIVGACVEVFFYLGKFLVPTGLLPVYPRWILDHPSLLEWLAVPLLAAVVGLIWHFRQHPWCRHVAFGLGFFLLMGLPTFGLVSMLYMRFSRVADHFVYLPMIGLIGLLTAGLEAGWRRLPPVARPAIPLAAAVVLALFAREAHDYSAHFVNQRTLWIYTVARNPDAWPAQNDLGLALLNEGNLAEAAVHFREALRVKPDYAEAHNNLGLVYLREALKAPSPTGRIEAAVPIAPGRPSPPVSPPGGEMAEAADEFRAALQIKPDYSDASGNLTIAMQHNQEPGVIGQYDRALQDKPDDIDTRNDLGLALLQAGRVQEATAQFQQVLRARPDYIDARNNLGLALLQTGHPADAIVQFEQALKIKPDFAEAHNNLGLALAQVGRYKEAVAHYRQALKFKPDYPDAKNNLYLAQQQALRQTALSKK